MPRPGDEDRDRSLWTRMKAGDATARDELILAHWALAKAMGRRAAHVPLEVEDRQSEAMLALIGCVDSWDPDRAPFSWWSARRMIGRLRDLAVSLRPRRRIGMGGGGGPDHALLLLLAEDPRRGELEAWESREDARRLLGRLRDSERALVERHYGIGGAPVDRRDLARTEGMGPTSIDRRLRRARTALRTGEAKRGPKTRHACAGSLRAIRVECDD